MDSVQTRQVATRQVPNNNTTAPVVTVSDTSAEDRLLEFVETQIEKIRAYTKIGSGSGMPGFYELNEALLDYTSIQASLISLDVIAKIECDKATEAFKDWQAQKYIEARTMLNPISVTASKWYSASEIEAYVRCKYKDEYNELHQNMTYAEMKVAAIRRLLDSWNTQSIILSRLCKNIETEMASMYNGNNIGLNN